MFNLTEHTRIYTLTPDVLGVPEGRDYLALEWWQYRWLGKFRGDVTIEVPPEDVAVIHAQPTGDVPSLVSVSHDITGGSIVRDVSFYTESGTLTGSLETKAGLRLVLFGSLPAGWRVSRETHFHTTASSCGGWQSEVVTTGVRTQFSVGFASEHE